MTVRVGKFEKISLEQWRKDTAETFNEDVREQYQNETYDGIVLPIRATKGSAGYDIKAPFSFSLGSGESIVIPTGLKCKVDNGWLLALFPKSGLGFKFKTRLANTVGIVDEDYFDNDGNEGHIMAKICNEGNKPLNVEEGKAFCQAIFLPYGITYDDESEGERKGGFGSTNS